MRNLLHFKALLFLCCASFYANAQVVTVINGTGSAGSASAPVNHSNAYSANEMIYLKTQINQAGTIYKVAFEKIGGTNTSPITNVNIYMKHTTVSALSAGAFDTTGYTRVYKGDFTNNATTGWMEVNLNTPFVYNNTDNLSILFFKKNGNTATGNIYRYAFVTRLATRRASNATGITNLSTSDALPNLRLNFTNPMGISKVVETAAFSLVPNPTTGTFSIENAGNATLVKVTDLSGRELLSKNVSANSTTLDLTGFAAGTYLIQVYSKEGVSVQRLLKD